MNWIKKNWSIILFAATVFVDYQFQILEAFEHSPKLVTATRILGLVALILINRERIKAAIDDKI